VPRKNWWYIWEDCNVGTIAEDLRAISDIGRTIMLLASLLSLFLAVETVGADTSPQKREQDTDFAKGVKNLQQQNWQEAIANFRKSLKSHPGHADAFFYLAQAYYQNGEVTEALTTIAEAARLDPESGEIKQKYGEYICEAGRCSRGVQMLLEARRRNPKLDHIDFDVGMAYYRLSNLEEATHNLGLALAHEPTNGEAAFFLAECYSIRADWPRAEEMYRRAVAAGKQDGSTYYGLGRALLLQDRPEAAVALLEEALILDPSLVECHFLMARALRSLGRNEEAERHLKIFQAVHQVTPFPTAESQEANPDEKAFWEGCQRLLEQGKEHQAIERLSSVNGGQHPYDLLGALYYSMGRLDDAQRTLKIAIQSDSRDLDALAWLGRTKLAKGALAEAELNFRQVLAMDSQNQLGAAGMGRVRHTQQQWAESAAWIERSKTRDPATLLDLCDDYLKLGRKDDAEIAAALVRSFGAGDMVVQSALEKLLPSH